MNSLSQLLQGFSYFLAKRLDKAKKKTPLIWLVSTLTLLFVLLAVHFNWFMEISDWLKLTIEGFIVGTLSLNGSRTTVQLQTKESMSTSIDVAATQETAAVAEPTTTEAGLYLKLERFSKQDTCTVSHLVMNDQVICKVLEDKDRGLTQSMPLAEIKKAKVYGETAIPEGTYRVVLSYSNKFRTYLPELIGVPGFSGIRIHKGNSSKQSEGCLLPVLDVQDTKGINSTAAFNRLLNLLKKEIRKQKVYITISSVA